jgi:DNA-binding transcriptional MerR regulator
LDPRVPDKQYFRIGEVAEIAQVETHVLRYWETEFRTLRPQKTRTNQRMYSRKDVEQVLRIRDLLYRDGFTISGARRKLHAGGADEPVELESADPLAQTRVKNLLDRVRKEVEELLQLVEE